jgi:DNA polymerase
MSQKVILSTDELIERFERLAQEARACNLCPRMTERVAVLSRLNGSLTPRMMVVCEAPGRQGADRTRIPLSGDASGRNFAAVLAAAGLTRDEMFITNSVMCSPRSSTGANTRPLASEIANCSDFLRRQLDLLQPPIVVALGGVALQALNRLEPHGLTLGEHVAAAHPWRGTLLAPMYHPSPQVIISRRSLQQQSEDWRALGEILKSLPPINRP